ncbi:MAG: dihydroorotase, partial [bacterium]|nr:dihydroorotase [bacterium]
LHPHHFCKPVAKTRKDRAALLAAALSGCPKFFFGSDSAPHPRGAKECADCCAGIFTAPVALPLLAEIFERHNALGRLESFARNFAIRFYDPPGSAHDLSRTLRLVKQPWNVPEEIGGIVPFFAGEEISWRVAEDVS